MQIFTFTSVPNMTIIAVLVLSLVCAVVAVPLDHIAVHNVSQFSGERIVGGSPAQRREFPYQVSYQKYNTHFCGGSILTETWILTASHCLAGTVDTRIVAGITNLGENHQDVQIRNIQQEIRHPRHPGGDEALPYDIALLRLTQPLQWTAAVKPISLPQANDQHTGMVWLTGWGDTSGYNLNTRSVPALQKVRMSLLSPQQCKNKDSFVDHTMVCVDGSNTGACSGDSGGPMMQNGVLVGVASWVHAPCGIGLSVYTRVSSHLQWIRQYVRV